MLSRGTFSTGYTVGRITMCGFTGFIDRSDRINDPNAALRAMSAMIAHRGPDGEGSYFEPRFGLGLAHRRFAG
jgi:asparagine synthase (glutamine-hydrolysing)